MSNGGVDKRCTSSRQVNVGENVSRETLARQQASALTYAACMKPDYQWMHAERITASTSSASSVLTVMEIIFEFLIRITNISVILLITFFFLQIAIYNMQPVQYIFFFLLE